MKKFFLALLLIPFIVEVQAQLQLPAPSPKASVTQTVGLTEISIEYSSPGLKGRKIWGDLVPYNEVWRAGANAPTTITFGNDVTIEGKNVPKGSYSLFIRPVEKGNWTIMLNKDATAGVSQRKEADDVVKINTRPVQTTESRERLAFTITDFDDNKAVVNMEWEKIRLPFTVNVDTDKQAMSNIDRTLGGSWRNYANAARYLLETKKDYDTGLTHVNRAIELSPDQWYSHWIRAQLLKEKGMNKEAIEAAQRAKTLGDKEGDGFFFRTQVEKALAEWPQQQGGPAKATPAQQNQVR
jgi:hypothetical protein